MKNSLPKKNILFFVSIIFVLLSNNTCNICALSHRKAKALLDKTYAPIGHKAYNIPLEEAEFIKKEKSDPLYGEMTLEAGQKLCEELKLTPQEELWDWGSGVGRLCSQAFLITP